MINRSIIEEFQVREGLAKDATQVPLSLVASADFKIKRTMSNLTTHCQGAVSSVMEGIEKGRKLPGWVKDDRPPVQE